MWDKHDNLLNGPQRPRRGNSDRLLHLDFVKKYIEVAKCIKPQLTEEACEMIGEEYSRLRSQDFEGNATARTQPVTARALETLIRLATAHAKARLSKSIESEDAETAIQLVQFAYFKKVEKKRKKRAHGASDDESGSEAEDNAVEEAMEEEDNTEEVVTAAVTKPPEAKKPRKEPSTDVEVSEEQYGAFKKALFAAFESSHQQQLPLDDVKKAVLDKADIDEAQLMKCIDKMSEDNKVMMASDILYLI